MNLDQLLLNIKMVSFDSLVCQADILSEADKMSFAKKGYNIPLTVDEFRHRFSLDPCNVWYTPSVSQQSLYFNPNSLAAAPFHLEYLLMGIGPSADGFYETIRMIENEVSQGQYLKAIISLPDAMQLEYFNKLIEKKGADIPHLYELFASIYQESDYGFGLVSPETLNLIFNSKTAEDRAKTAAALQGLPDTVKVYRGGNSESLPYKNAYSWTLDINVANFFASRRGTGDGYILEAEIAKQDIIDLLDGRSEQEVLVNPQKVTVLDEIPILGLDFLKDVLPRVAPMFHKYKEALMKLDFTQDSIVHGYGHEARVMLLSLIISEGLDLPLRDRAILAEAAIYHDLRRVNDIDDSQHGRDAREYFRSTGAQRNHLVEFLCEFHCLPDEEGYQEIQNNRKLKRENSRAKLLFDIFKDADALDRCRFGLRDLDINQLRLPVSKQLSLVARLCFEQVKVPERTSKERASLDSQIHSAVAAATESAAAPQRLCNKRSEPAR